MNFEECVRRGYLRRIEPQSELGRLSLTKARSFLESARKNLDMLDVKRVRYIDYVRTLRHQTKYDVGFSPEPEEVEPIIPKVKAFIEVVENIFGGGTDG